MADTHIRMAPRHVKNPFLILVTVIYAAYTSRPRQAPLMGERISRSALTFLEARTRSGFCAKTIPLTPVMPSCRASAWGRSPFTAYL